MAVFYYCIEERRIKIEMKRRNIMVLLYDCTVLASFVCVRLDVIEARKPEIADPPVRWETERG